jgi:hypothetical protein
MEIVYVGLDLGSSSFQQVAMKVDGSVRVNRSFTTSETNLRAAFADQRGEVHVHLEAGELAPSVIASLVTRAVCSHPQSNAWIAKDADKCDRIDAYKLAELLRLNRFKEVHYAPDQPRRNFKQLVQHYDELTAQQARLKTKIKARLRMQGVIVTGERLFSITGRKEVLARVDPATSHGYQATLRGIGSGGGGARANPPVDAARGPGFPGNQAAAYGARGGSHRCLSLQCLHSHPEPLQLEAQAVEVLPAERESPQQ